MDSIPVITIDGPSGVGKGTLAKALAKHTRFNQLDSGAIYRLCSLYAINNNISFENEANIKEILSGIKISFSQGKVFLNDEDVTKRIRDEEVSINASKIAQYASLRDGLHDYMRSFLVEPGLIADGRDMGTNVFPEAKLKIFLLATPEERARRRFNQLKEQDKNANIKDVLSNIIARDKRDEKRQVSPLEPAKEAVLVDTSLLTIEEVFLYVLGLIRERHIVI